MNETLTRTTNVDALLTKLQSAEIGLSEKHGPFALFVLLARPVGDDTWDLVVSAPWWRESKPKALATIVDALRSSFTPEEFLRLSRIVILDGSDPFVQTWNQFFRAEHALITFSNLRLVGSAGAIDISTANLISSNPEAVPATVKATATTSRVHATK